jgi:hypothetical protein
MDCYGSSGSLRCCFTARQGSSVAGGSGGRRQFAIGSRSTRTRRISNGNTLFSRRLTIKRHFTTPGGYLFNGSQHAVRRLASLPPLRSPSKLTHSLTVSTPGPSLFFGALPGPHSSSWHSLAKTSTSKAFSASRTLRSRTRTMGTKSFSSVASPSSPYVKLVSTPFFFIYLTYHFTFLSFSSPQ